METVLASFGIWRERGWERSDAGSRHIVGLGSLSAETVGCYMVRWHVRIFVSIGVGRLVAGWEGRGKLRGGWMIRLEKGGL